MKLPNTEAMKNGLLCSIDYMRFTFFEDSGYDPQGIVQLLGYVPFDFVDGNGGMGYRASLLNSTNGLQIYYDGRSDMGIHVNVPGKAVADVLLRFAHLDNEKSYSSADLAKFFRVIGSCAHFTRIDLAVDDFGAFYFTLDDIDSLNRNNQITSKWKSISREVSNELGNYENRTGDTIYFGKRTSGIMLRVYDKKLEQKLSKDCMEWVRWELEIKKDNGYADSVARRISNEEAISAIFFGLLKNYLRFIVRDDENVSRCSTLPMWDTFLVAVEKVSLYVPRPDSSLNQKKKWIVEQVSPTLSAIALAEGGLGFVDRAIAVGAFRMKDELKRKVEKENPGIVDHFKNSSFIEKSELELWGNEWYDR